MFFSIYSGVDLLTINLLHKCQIEKEENKETSAMSFHHHTVKIALFAANTISAKEKSFFVHCFICKAICRILMNTLQS